MVDKYIAIDCNNQLSEKCIKIKDKISGLNSHIKEVKYNFFLRNDVEYVMRFTVITNFNIYSPILLYGDSSEKNIENTYYDNNMTLNIERELINLAQELEFISVELIYQCK